MTKSLGTGRYCMGSEAECQGFSHGCKQAATAPRLLPTFKKEGGKLALSSGSNSFLNCPLTPVDFPFVPLVRAVSHDHP